MVFLKRGIFSLVLLILLLLAFAIPAFAHEGDHEETEEGYIATPTHIGNIGNVTYYGSIAFLALILISVLFKKRLKEQHKKILFALIALLIITVTVYIVWTSIYINSISETKGPVHWHADYEIWICEEEIDLEDPKLPLNRIGTYVLHDHGDNRIHIEGVVLDKRDVSLGAFFHAIGGKLSKEEMIVPTNQGLIEASEGDLCDGSPGKLYVFVKGKLVEDHSTYVIQPYETIPPGDTIKVVFSSSSLEEIDPNIKGYDREKRI